MYNSAFTPSGPTVLVGTSEVAVPSAYNVGPTSYRIRNITASAAYISWLTPNTSGTAAITVAAPTNGVPSANTISIAAGICEKLSLPQNAVFKASASAAFEVTPGEGV